MKETTEKTIKKLGELVQSPIIRAISNEIVDAYLDPSKARNVLIDITELQFKQHIDAASLTLIYPLCDKVFKRDSAIQNISSFDRMKHLHIKTIAASVVGLLSEITNA